MEKIEEEIEKLQVEKLPKDGVEIEEFIKELDIWMAEWKKTRDSIMKQFDSQESDPDSIKASKVK